MDTQETFTFLFEFTQKRVNFENLEKGQKGHRFMWLACIQFLLLASFRQGSIEIKNEFLNKNFADNHAFNFYCQFCTVKTLLALAKNLLRCFKLR